VDLPLLKLALKRINVPTTIINFIHNLFFNHQNRIILPNGLSDPYDLQTGIIQGEIISPLLWVIYYDPMFAAINNLPTQGFTLKASLPKNIHTPLSTHQLSLDYKLIGYLDDTTWFASDLSTLEQHLAIADDFYALANIKINKLKTKLLTNDKNILADNQLLLAYGNDLISTTVVPKNKSERILGIYVSISNNATFTVKKIKKMLHFICSNLRRKKITHDHVMYVINKVLLPRIEYLCQHFFILPHTCNEFNRILRSVYKSSLLLPKSMFNSVVHNPIYPNILNIWDHQIRAQASLLNAHANNPNTSLLIKFLILSSQNKLWTDNVAEVTKYFNYPTRFFNRLENLMCIFHHYNLSFSFSYSFPVDGGNHPLSYFITDPKQYLSFVQSLKNKHIFFLDQIISPDGAFLLSWKDIKKSLCNKRGRKPKWITFLEEHILINPNSRRLSFTIPNPVIVNPQVSRPRAIAHNNRPVRSPFQWITYWSPSHSDVIYGRIKELTHHPGHPQMAYIQHYIRRDTPSSSSTTASPHSTTNILIPCQGCSLDEPYYLGDIHVPCKTSLISGHCINIHVSVHDKHKNKQFQSYRTTKPHTHYRALAFHDYRLRVPAKNLPTPFQPSSLMEGETSSNKFLINSILLPVAHFDRLITLSDELSSYQVLEFYTDGSLIRLNTNSYMGYGWIFSSDSSLNISYSGSAIHWASSTKAEILAILTALIVCPQGSTVDIYTDSACAISTFNSLHDPKLTPRRFQKINNVLLWQAIKHIIVILNLKVSLHKVKAHSDNIYNDMADNLAKQAARDHTFFTSVSVKGLPEQLGHLTFNNDVIIDRNIRKTLKTLINFRTLENHISHRNLSHVQRMSYNNSINWLYSQRWIKYNPFDRATSLKYSKLVSWRIKTSTSSLPTLDILNRNYPDLLNGFTECFFCHSELESNDHLWSCTKVLELLRPIFLNHQNILRNLLITNSDISLNALTSALLRCPLFNWTDTPLSTISRCDALHCFLINLIPDCLIVLFQEAKFTDSRIKPLLFPFIYAFHIDIYNAIWRHRSIKWKEWKATNNISKKSFREYSRYHRRARHHTSSNDPTIDRSGNNLRSYSHPFSLTCSHTDSIIMWVYLTTSNFLHNVPWISSLSTDLTSVRLTRNTRDYDHNLFYFLI
jgi:ribonuclease HI